MAIGDLEPDNLIDFVSDSFNTFAASLASWISAWSIDNPAAVDVEDRDLAIILQGAKVLNLMPRRSA